MARWRLAAPHYLMTGDTKWEYSEVDRTTGRPKRTQFDVPRLLNPEDPGDWNHVYSKDGFGKPDTGEIIIAQGDHDPKDIMFLGDVTPDMVPLDEEAKKLSAASEHKWKYSTKELNGTYADEMMKDLSAQVDEVREKSAAPSEAMNELLTAMAAMMKQNQEMMAALVSAKAPVAASAGRGR